MREREHGERKERERGEKERGGEKKREGEKAAARVHGGEGGGVRNGEWRPGVRAAFRLSPGFHANLPGGEFFPQAGGIGGAGGEQVVFLGLIAGEIEEEFSAIRTVGADDEFERALADRAPRAVAAALAPEEIARGRVGAVREGVEHIETVECATGRSGYAGDAREGGG